jgi:branched-chain amino acid transport system substrate-binding protein
MVRIGFLAGMLALSLSSAAVAADTAGKILIGQSAGFTGGQAAYSKDLKSGIDAYIAHTNKSGGVNGRQLQLLSLDDQGKKSLTASNTKQLIETDKVFALIGYTSGAGVEESLAFIRSSKVPMLSPATGNMGIRASFDRYLFHTRAGYGEEMRRVVGYLALTGTKRLAIVYLEDAGPDNPKAMHAALAAHGLKAVVEVPLNRNAEDFTPQVDTLMKANPEAVLFISNAKPLAKVIRGMKARGYGGRFVTSSFSGMGVVTELQAAAHGLIMIQVLPPVARTSLRLVKDYTDHLKALAPEAKPNYTGLEGYVSARVLVEGIKRAGANPSRERFIEALESIRSFDLGGYEINFSDKEHDGSRYVDTGVVTQDGKLRF